MTLEYKLKHSGLGTVIGALSMLMSSGQHIKLYAEPGQLVHKLKYFLNISDDRLTISSAESTADDISNQLGDQGKYFSPYFNVDNVCVFGQTLPTRYGLANTKPCIGLVMYADRVRGINNNNQHPHNRYYSQEEYAKIFQLITDSGYDVITLNSRDVDLEQKIFILNELCDAVIGYEGGMCHLAHLLKIPAIILPYHHDGAGNGALIENGQINISLWHATHLLHIDRRTYFLNSVEEIINWTPEQLKKQISNLYNQQGNNVAFKDDVFIEPHTLIVKLPGFDNITPLLTDFEKKFIHTYFKELKIG